MCRSSRRITMPHWWRNRSGRPTQYGREDRNQHHGDHAGLALDNDGNDHGEDRSECAHPDCHHQQ